MATDIIAESASAAPSGRVRFGEVGLTIEARDGGILLLGAKASLRPYEENLLKKFWANAERWPERTWLARRAGAERSWQRLSYQHGRADVSAVAAWLERLQLAPQNSVMILSENSLAHATWIFGAIAAGVPVCSVAVNYSLLGGDFERLRRVSELIRPRVIFAEQGAPFAAAIRAIATDDTIVVSCESEDLAPGAVKFAEILTRPDVAGTGARIATLNPSRPARYMLTSGSSGTPKAVIHTQATITASANINFQAMSEALAWDHEVLDWLPWNHISGSSLLTNVSYLGGSLYIDDGRPTPERIGETVKNLSEIPVRYYGNVPAGYAMLADALESNPAMCEVFYRELRAMLFGGAGLPQALHDRLQNLSVKTTGHTFAFLSGYGSTETTSAISCTYWHSSKVGIGLPLPGVQMKLVPAESAYEVWVKSPSLMPGYLSETGAPSHPFDQEGFYRMGDLVQFHDPLHPEQGLFFFGRQSDQFKLANATFVASARLREALLRACPEIFRDVVVCGEGQAYPAALAWTKLDSSDAIVRSRVERALAQHNLENPGQSTRILRVLFLSEPPNAQAGEITEKGTINRNQLLRRRSGDVARLYAEPIDTAVIAAASVL
jgi:feruloyl-CoA synthase